MNISYNWLKRYIDFNLSPNELADAFTSLGLETGTVEKVETIKGGLEGLVVGKVLTCVPHPDSDHLHVTTVDLGDGDPVTIVCGAPNIAAGQHVIVATVGTTLYDGDKEFKIKKSKIRGVESFGMICAEDEIGVGTSHAGTIELPLDVPAGTLAKNYYNINDDYILEVDLTPNRIDGASHYGCARDLAAWLTQHGKAAVAHRPDVSTFKADRADGGIPVTVENVEACPRYCGVTIRGVKVKESPDWLKSLLNAIGQRPINNIVDITNFILLGLGQPLHCFDLAKVKGDKVIVKTVPEGTKFVTLDGVERTLTARDLMICNTEEPMCIGGVFGGLDSGVTEATTDIFLESAYFHPTWIRKTARRFGLNTDASFRFERGIDPNDTVYNLKAAALLVKELAGGEICGDIVDVKSREFPKFPVSLNYAYMNALIGKAIGTDTVKSILRSLEIEITDESEYGLELLVPTHRVDVQRPCDVVEDILRVYGYNNVEFISSIHGNLSSKGDTDVKADLQSLVSGQLTAVGFNEIMNNSLTAAAYYTDLTTYPEDNCVHLLNPLSSDLNVLRQSLLFGGLESIARNINHKNSNLKFYEFGNVYRFDPEAKPSEKILAAFSEHTSLALWLTGDNHGGNWAEKSRKTSPFDLKAVVEGIFLRVGIASRDLVIEQTSSDIYSAALTFSNRGGKRIGELGVLRRAVLKKMDIDQEVVFAQLNWDAIIKMTLNKKVNYTDLPKTLPVKRDLALLVDKAVTFADIRNVITSSEKHLLKDVSLFDVYEGKNLPADKKSYAVSIILQDDEKTMQDKQIDAIMNKIVTNLQKQVGATLR
ncbi:MAG: phenylalanine--tRNA ligase subunit beta [Muribaculaceae bacterium]|jgi:phenylalanyl-tRNA synthetase beta chain|nr:phenylalanine--tRNA ligase subunit beta [Muribaculaceae bacterium]